MADRLASPSVLPDAHQPEPRDALYSAGRLLLAVMFGGFIATGLIDGGGGVLWPEVTDDFGVSGGVFGLAAGLGLLVGFPVMAFSGKLADRFDQRTLLLMAFVVAAIVSLLIVVGAPGGALLLIGIFLLRGLASSVIDLSNNALAIDVERSTGRHILGPLHAMYSAGSLAGALGVWIVFTLGGGYRTVYLIFALCFLVLALMAWRSRALPAPPTAPTESVAVSTTLSLLRVGEIRLLGAIAALSMFGTILFSQWVGLYLDEVHEAGQTARVLAVAAYGAMKIVGRLVSGPILLRIGVRSTLVGYGSLLAAGGILVSLDAPIAVAVIGCGVAGLGLAGLLPLTLSIGGSRFASEGTAVAGVLLFIGYTGLVAGPLLAGLMTTLVSDWIVMPLTALAGLLVIVAAFRLRNSVALDGTRPASA